MKAKRIVMTVALLVIVLAMACALVSCDLFGGGSDDKDTTYAVTLECDSSKGSVSGGGKFKKGDSVAIIATANEGYSFTGWYDGETKVSDQAEWAFSMGEKAITYTAKFSVNSYTVNLDCDMLKGSVTGGGNYEYGSSVTITAIPNTGYSFIGWYEGDTLVSDQAEYTITKISQNVTYIAKFSANKHTVIVECNSTQGSVTGGGNYDYGSSVAIKAIANEGYAFIGWYDGETLISSNSEYIFLMDDFDKKYTALFKILSKVKLECDLSQGSVRGSGCYNNGSSVSIFATPNIGYSFIGWYEGETLISSEKNYNFFIGEADVNYIAKFKSLPKITLEYDKSQGSVTGSGFYDNGTSVTISATAKAGYSFLGWYDGEDVLSTVATYTFVMGENNVKYIAKFSINRYMVNLDYDSVQGSVTGGGEYEYNSTVTITATANDGYSFVGWYKGDEIISTQYVYKFKMGSANTNYTARFDINKYHVTLKCDSIQGNVTGNGDFIYGSNVMIHATPNTGYSFVGWYEGETQISDKTEFTIVNISENLTYTARFIINKYAVTIDCDLSQGNGTGSGDYDYGSSVSIKANANKGYSFVGWYVGEKLITENSEYTFVIGDYAITYTAIFSINKYVVDIDYESSLGNIIGSGEYEYGSIVTIIATPNIGYTFIGWYVGETFISDKLNYTFKLDDSDITYTAKFNVAPDLAIYKFSTLDNGELRIDGLKEEYRNVENIVIPNFVSQIGTGAFRSCESIRSVIIGSNVTHIASYVFYGCIGLDRIIIPDSVETIDNFAFDSCTNITSVTIGSGLKNINDFVFSNCNSITSVMLSYAVANIDLCAFKNCDKISEVRFNGSIAQWCAINGLYALMANRNGVKKKLYIAGKEIVGELIIPHGVESIGNYAFYECDKLLSVTLPDSILIIGDNSFAGCYALTKVYYNGTIAQWCAINGLNNLMVYSNKKLYIGGSIVDNELVIPDGVENIGSSAFSDCNGLTSIIIPDSVTTIGSYAFGNCYNISEVRFYGTIDQWCTISGLSNLMGNGSRKKLFIADNEITDLIIPDSITKISSGAFCNCSSLTSITIGSGVRIIDEFTFEGCINLANVILADGVTSIEKYAFNNSQELVSITIPDSVISIENGAFYGINNISEVHFNGTLEQWCIINGIGNLMINGADKKLYIGDNLITKLVIPDGVTSISDNMFSGCDNITSILIPDSVTSIGSNAFYSCENLTNVTIGNGVESIGNSAFAGCHSLTKVTIGRDLTYIGNSAFIGCSKISEIHYNATLSQWFAICGLNELMSYGLNKKLYIDGNEVTELVIPEGTRSIADYMFYGCSYINTVTIPNSLINIGTNAFDGCRALVEIYNFSNINITKGESNNGCIAYYALDVYTSMELKSKLSEQDNMIIHIDGDNVALIKYIGNASHVIIPDSVTSITDRAFLGCTSLISVTVGSGVTSIGESAFEDCYALTEIYNFSNLDIRKGSTNHGFIAYYAHDVFNTSSELSRLMENDEMILHIDGSNITLVKYLSDEKYAIIPDIVTNIGSNAFYGCGNLSSIKIPYSVTNIGLSAFYDCILLTKIHYNGTIAQWCNINGIENLMQYGLNKKLYIGDSEVTELIIPDGVTNINTAAFYDCINIISVNISDSVTSIGRYAFYDCSGLTCVTIGSRVTNIDYGAFRNCVSIDEVYYSGTTVQWCNIIGLGNLMRYGLNKKLYIEGKEVIDLVIPDSVTNINNYSFSNCSSITSVTIPNTVTVIGEWAFYRCINLSSVAICSGVTRIDMAAFQYCISIDEIYYSGTTAQWCNIIGLGNLMRYGLNKKLYIEGKEVIDLVIPDSVTNINNYSFSNCSSITSVTIPNSVTVIGEWAFYRCSTLSSVTIGSGITNLGFSAFKDCNNISEVHYNGTIAQWCAISGLGNLMNYGSNKKLYIGGSEVREIVIPNGVTSIDSSLFRGCSGLTSVTIPSSVTSIGESAFLFCSSLTSVTFENTTGWFVSGNSDATSGTDVTVTNPSQNAKYLTSTHCVYYWKRDN